jgi:hypothetical protein
VRNELLREDGTCEPELHHSVRFDVGTDFRVSHVRDNDERNIRTTLQGLRPRVRV